MIRKTSLHAEHVKLGAKMMEFGGWDMPLSYSSQIEEHQAVRKNVGMFDVGHMGVITWSPASADHVLTRATRDLKPYRIRYNRFKSATGGIVDDILVYRDSGQDLVVINAGNRRKDMEFLDTQKIEFDTTPFEIIAVQGPQSVATLQPFSSINLSEIPYYGFAYGKLWDVVVMFSRTGYTGEDGFEIFTRAPDTQKLWQKLLEQKVPPCGLAARDTLRIEAGMPLYGHELRDEWADAESKKLIGVVLEGRNMAREGFKVYSAAGLEIGVVTSGTFSPTLQKPVAIVYLPQEYTFKEVHIDIRGKKVLGNLQPLPFYKRQRS